MTDPRRTATNAADSAPGVDDGRKGAPPPPVNSKPGARRPVFWIVGACLLLLVIVFIARPFGGGSDDEMVGVATASGEIAASDAPGQSQPATAPAPQTP